MEHSFALSFFRFDGEDLSQENGIRQERQGNIDHHNEEAHAPNPRDVADLYQERVFRLGVREIRPRKCELSHVAQVFQKHPHGGDEDKEKPGGSVFQKNRCPAEESPIKTEIYPEEKNPDRDIRIVCGKSIQPENIGIVKGEAETKTVQESLPGTLKPEEEEENRDQGKIGEEGEIRFGERRAAQESGDQTEGNPTRDFCHAGVGENHKRAPNFKSQDKFSYSRPIRPACQCKSCGDGGKTTNKSIICNNEIVSIFVVFFSAINMIFSRDRRCFCLFWDSPSPDKRKKMIEAYY
jgi:hypothetical protein